MIELVQLEKRHADFEGKNVRVIVVSMEGPDDAEKTQADFPHLTVLADEKRGLSEALGVVQPHGAPDGRDIDVPTTLLADRGGTVRWVYRPAAVITRLSPDALLQAVDQNFPKGP